MFDVQINLEISGKDYCAGVSRNLRLPFVPFPGLRLIWKCEGHDNDEVWVDVDRVEWDESLEMFILSAEHEESFDCPCEPHDDCCTLANHLLAWAPEGSGFEILSDARRWYWFQLEEIEFDPARRSSAWPQIVEIDNDVKEQVALSELPEQLQKELIRLGQT